jgi:hypothetical protein
MKDIRTQTKLAQIIIIVLGGVFGYCINLLISPYPYFLSLRSYELALGFMVAGSFWFFFVVFKLNFLKCVNKYAKSRLILLGAGFTSIILASYTFFSYIAVLYFGGANMGSLFNLNIFKSLLLISLFSLVERFIRFLEDQETAQTPHRFSFFF